MKNNYYYVLSEPQTVQIQHPAELEALVKNCENRTVLVSWQGVSKEHEGRLITKRITFFLGSTVTKQGHTMVTIATGSKRAYKKKKANIIKSFRWSSLMSVEVLPQ